MLGYNVYNASFVRRWPYGYVGPPTGRPTKNNFHVIFAGVLLLMGAGVDLLMWLWYALRGTRCGGDKSIKGHRFAPLL